MAATGCTTESLRWQDDDYSEHAGTVYVRPTEQADSTPHLFFVDLEVTNLNNEAIVLERIEGGKLLSILLEAERTAQAVKGSGATVHRCIPRRLP